MSVQLIEELSDSHSNMWLLEIGFVEFNYANFRRQKVDQFLRSYLPEISFEHRDGNAPAVINRDLKMSISYSKTYAAIIISKYRCGIDIQTKDAQIELANRLFLTDSELKLIQSRAELFIAFSAKESVFKLLAGKVKSFKKDLTIQSINEHDVIIDSKKSQFIVNFENRLEFVLTYVVDRRKI